MIKTKNRNRKIAHVALGFFHATRFLNFSYKLIINSFTNNKRLIPSINYVILPYYFFNKLYLDSSFSFFIFLNILIQGSYLKKECSLAHI